ncbi:MrpH family fimbial adhesin [Providencia hangzhouensis]|uniref:MrpH family fimbial adhesin n=1 Tax=Providencia hangzhouensis TaxID=3031799 RepID=UPI003F6908F9
MASIIEAAQSQCGLTFPRRGESRHSGSITTDECVGIFVGETAKKLCNNVTWGNLWYCSATSR